MARDEVRRKKWREENRERTNANARRRRKEQVEKFRPYWREYYRRTKGKRLDDRRRHYEKQKALGITSHQKDRKKCFDQYGAICACCGETEILFLTFDHINNDGL